MTAARAVDYEEMKTGFQSPRAARLADWAFKKEKAEFAVLVNRLRARKWAKDNPARATARSLRYQAKPGVRDHMNEMQNRRRFAPWAKRAGAGIECACCGVLFCEARPRKGKARRFCTPRCCNRFCSRRNYQRRRA